MQIKIKYKNDEIVKLEQKEGSDWCDMRCAESITLKKGEYKLIPLGVAMELPKNHEAHVAPRGSTFKNYGLIQTNSVGIIDEKFSGDNDWWFMPVYATRDITIPKNDRICQFRIMEKQPKLDFIVVDSLGNVDRGGHGSTGVK